MNKIEVIQAKARVFSESRASVAAIVSELNGKVEALKRETMPKLKKAIGRAAEHQAELNALIEKNPELFTRPKTVIFSGIKLGYQKGKGSLEFNSAESVIKLIRKHFPEKAEVLIETKESPVKTELAKLPAADLKRLGCTLVGTGDAVLIKPADSDVDKLVDALLKGATKEEA